MVKKYIKLSASILWWITVILTVFLLISVVTAKFKGEVPKVFGYSVMKIVSGSMEPKIPTGAYILVEDCDPERIKEGDIISFYSRDIAIYGMPNTHRVVEITENEGKREYITKGDANGLNDTNSVKEDDVIGIYKSNLNHLTDFSKALESGGMFFIIIIIMISIVTVTTLTAVVQKKEE